LKGNPVVKEIPHYRKTIVGRCQELRYLDDRPVFEEERGRCNAWYKAFKEGGEKVAQQAELDEIKRQREVKRAKEEANHKAFKDMMEKGRIVRRQREEAEKMVEANGALDFNIFSGMPILGDGSLPTPDVTETDDDVEDDSNDGEGADTEPSASSANPPNVKQKTTLPSNIFGGEFQPAEGEDDGTVEDAPPLEDFSKEDGSDSCEGSMSPQELVALKLEELKQKNVEAGVEDSKLSGLLAAASEDVAKEVIVIKEEGSTPNTEIVPDMDEMD